MTHLFHETDPMTRGKPKYERRKNELYCTRDRRMIPMLISGLESIGHPLKSSIIDPSAGHGHISELLRYLGYTVTTSDIEDYGKIQLDYVTDFLQMKSLPAGVQAIVTNPPFGNQFINGQKLIDRYVEHCLYLASKANAQVFLLMKHEFEAATGHFRRAFFQHPNFVCRFNIGRPYFEPTAPNPYRTTPRMPYCWYAFSFADDRPTSYVPTQYLDPPQNLKPLCVGDEINGFLNLIQAEKIPCDTPYPTTKATQLPLL